MDEYIETHTKVLLEIMQYSSNLLREIWKKARTNYEDFKIHKATGVWIIVLEIRKHLWVTPTGQVGISSTKYIE